MIRALRIQERVCRSVFGPGFGGGAGGPVTEASVDGVSSDPGQVLGTGLDGGVLLLGADIIGAIDTDLGSIAWRQADAELVLSYDGATRSLSIAGGTGTALPLATDSLDGLMAAADKARLDGIEAGATADQTGQEMASAIAAEPTAVSTLAVALAVPATAGDVGAAAAVHGHVMADIADLPSLGTAAGADASAFATAAEGALAASALQPGTAPTAIAPDPVSSVGTSLTLTPADARRFIKLTAPGNQVVTVDADALAADEYVTLVKTGNGTFDVVAGSGGAVLLNATGGTLMNIGQFGVVSIKATDMAGEYIVIGAGG